MLQYSQSLSEKIARKYACLFEKNQCYENVFKLATSNIDELQLSSKLSILFCYMPGAAGFYYRHVFCLYDNRIVEPLLHLNMKDKDLNAIVPIRLMDMQEYYSLLVADGKYDLWNVLQKDNIRAFNDNKINLNPVDLADLISSVTKSSDEFLYVMHSAMEGKGIPVDNEPFPPIADTLNMKGDRPHEKEKNGGFFVCNDYIRRDCLMRSYRAHFSYYAEEWGNFDDMAYTVQAESPFEARIKAWEAWDQDEDTKFRSCVKLYAVTWNPNPLDAGDYFYSHAADIKQAVGHIENVDIPNDRIQKHDRAEYYEKEKHYYLGSLRTIDAVAQDLYADRGMIPPSIYEELHYAEELCDLLENFNQAQALWDKVSAAKKWDEQANLFDIRDLLKKGYITLQDEAVFFREHFGRTGIYPVYANLDDTDYKYISRWQRSWKVNSLANLRPLQPADVISHSASHMLYDYQLLLVNYNHFPADYQKPENMIWTPSEDSMNITKDMTEKFLVDNVITGERILADRSDFWGVIRPDVVARYNFEALKSEYSAAHEMQNGITGAENGEIYPADYDEPGLEDGMEV